MGQSASVIRKKKTVTGISDNANTVMPYVIYPEEMVDYTQELKEQRQKVPFRKFYKDFLATQSKYHKFISTHTS